jgi:hypothetical protein
MPQTLDPSTGRPVCAPVTDCPHAWGCADCCAECAAEPTTLDDWNDRMTAEHVAMTTDPYAAALEAIRAAENAADRRHLIGSDEWRTARAEVRARVLLEIAHPGDHLALTDPERRTVAWLAGQDAPTVAGVAALLASARANAR